MYLYLVSRRRIGRFAAQAISLFAFASAATAATFSVSTPTQFTTALTSVRPGDTIVLSGTIAGGKFATSVHGTSAAPITIRGDGTARISGSPYALEILHDYYRLENFIVQNSAKGVVVTGGNHGKIHRVHAMSIRQEAFKWRESAQYWEVTYCSARDTGTSGDYGEGFYVGQAASNWSGGPDQCAYITFFNCYATDTVNDGWDLKEGSHHIKVVNCTADYSGSIEPAAGEAHGNAGFYNRADNVQYIKCRVNALDNGTWGYRFSNDTADGVDYGSAGNQIKQSAVTSGNVGFIFAESGTNGVVFNDYIETSSGGFYATNNGTQSAPVTIADPSTFSERTWSGEGGGLYGSLDGSIGASGDPMGSTPTPTVEAPVFSPGGGTYTTAQSVTITTATSGATIRYTTNGSDPTTSTGTVYTGPVTVGASSTLKALAYKSGMNNSVVSSATYTINSGGTVATPTFTPAPGTYTTAQSVALSSATSGTTIRYTVNGAAPTSTSGTIYSGPISVGSNATIRALAYRTGMVDSPIATGTYTINVSGGTKFTIAGSSVTASSHDGNVPANTVDGNLSTRWSASGDGQWIRYDLGSAQTIGYVKIAFYSGNTRSTLFDLQVSNDGTNFTNVFSGQSSGTTTAFETFDFADVSARYVRVLGHGNTSNAWNSIAETEIWGSGTSGGTVAAPSFSPGGGSYATPQSVTIATSTAGATIRYSTNGTDPTATTGTIYTGPVTVSTTSTLKAIATKSGMTDSGVTAASYTIGGSTTTVLADNFDAGTVGAAPAGWTISAPAGTTATVQAVPSTANKSLRFTDTTTGGYSSAYRSFTAQTGTISVQVSFNASASWCRFFLQSGTTVATELYTKDGQIVYRNGSGTDVAIAPFTGGSWNTLKIVANPATDTMDVYVNGTLRVSNVAFRTAVSSLDRVLFSSGGSTTGTHYIDDVLVTR